MLEIIVLAAGKGTRMCSDKPKVLHSLAGRPLLAHVIDQASALAPDKIHVVVGHAADQVRAAMATENDLNFVEQKEQLGTGHAVLQALPALNDKAKILILYGDVPLIAAETLTRLLAGVSENSIGLLTTDMANPEGYGRILRDDNGNVRAIVEEKDATDTQKVIQEVNTGVMAMTANHLKSWLPRLSNDNAQGEYYLTDTVAIARVEEQTITVAQPKDSAEVLGVNTRSQQAQLERLYQQRLADTLMNAGLTLMDPLRFDCRGMLKVGSDCLIDINCVFEGDVELGNDVQIGPNCSLKNAVIGDGCRILANSVIDGATVAEHCNIGPFARLRPGTRLANKARIGNFVETKQATIGSGSKINHLSYIGDAEVGSDVNIGAGTITCNYDGANKHKTMIRDGAFVGSNTALVAPVALGKNTTVAAGSVITTNVQEGQLGVGRSGQRNIDGWKRPAKKT